MDSVKQIPEHIKRVISEHSELIDKITKLGNFINCENTDMFKNLPEDEQKRMIRQKEAMIEYASILQERIDAALK